MASSSYASAPAPTSMPSAASSATAVTASMAAATLTSEPSSLPSSLSSRIIQKSAFRPWNSFVAKKAAAEAATAAAAHANSSVPAPQPAVKRLTVALIDTYESINYAYYHAASPETSSTQHVNNISALPAAESDLAPLLLHDKTRSQRRSISSAASSRAPAGNSSKSTTTIQGSANPSAGTNSSASATSPSAGSAAAAVANWTAQGLSRRASSSTARLHGRSHQRRPSVNSATSPTNPTSGTNSTGSSKSNATARHTAIPDRPSPAVSTVASRAISNVAASSHASSIATALSNFFHGSGSFTRHSSSAVSSSQSARSSVSSSPNFSRSNTQQNASSEQSLSHSTASQRSQSSQAQVQLAPSLVDSQPQEQSSKQIPSAADSKKSQTSSSTVPGARQSPHSVQYCDANYDYIVRPGDMFHNRYMLEKVIGRGSFGQVVRAYDTRMKAHVAIKIIKNNSLYVEQALSEVRMTAYLNRIDPDDAHSIMRIFDRFIFRGHQCLVLELLSFSLYDLLRSTEFYGVSLNLVRKFSRQILNCLAFLARPDVNIAHCDLKPENVLLRHPQRSAIKVVDFGASCRVSDSMFTYVQSRFYRAPEVILGLPYNTQVDVWSLGCMLVELHTGYPLFAGQDEADQMAVIVERLGTPPKHMLDKGKKTQLFFDRVPVSSVSDNARLDVSSALTASDSSKDEYTWVLKPNIAKKEGGIVPGSKPIQSFIDELTSSSGGRRKRISGGHSEADYQVFMDLSLRMLCYDPTERITASLALHDSFVAGSTGSGAISGTSGRDSPPHMNVPNLTSSITALSDVEPGRAAPVHPRVRHAGNAGNAVSDAIGKQDSFGGALRLSKSESAIPPVVGGGLGFHSSVWAEEVGIDPPPWRSIGPSIMRLERGQCYRVLEEDEGDSTAPHCEYLANAGGGKSVNVHQSDDSHRYFWRRDDRLVPRLKRVVSRLPVPRVQLHQHPSVASAHCTLLNRVACL